MAKIKINVTGHLFTVTEFPLITDNNVNVDEIEAEFDESWDGYAKIAVFKKKSWQNSLCTLFDCNNIAKLPDTVGSGKLILGIVGIDSESQITTNIKTISIAESAEFDGIEAPEEDVYRQILDSYARVINQRSEIDAEIHRVEAQANANYETVNERVNNLVATDPGSTGDNAELLDIRVGSDGKTYPTAGDAVRVQVSELKSDIVTLKTTGISEHDIIISLLGYDKNIDITVTPGCINASDGNDVEDSLSTKTAYIDTHGANLLQYNSNFTSGFVAAFYYDAKNKFIAYESSGEANNSYSFSIPLFAKYVRLSFAYISDKMWDNHTATAVLKNATDNITNLRGYDLSKIKENSIGVSKSVKMYGSFYNLNSVKAPFDNADTLPNGSVVSYGSFKLSTLKNFPAKFEYGCTILTLNGMDINDSKIQIAVSRKGQICSRMCSDGNEFTDWMYPVNKTINQYMTMSIFQDFGVIGDSYASGAIYDNTNETWIQNYAISWGQVLARMIGATCINYSTGGLTTRTWLTDAEGLTKLNSNKPNQLYFLNLGINDVKLGIDYIGAESDLDNPDEHDTFYGNMGKIINAIKNHAPKSKIVISEIIGWQNNTNEYNEAIHTICTHYHYILLCAKSNDYFGDTIFWTSQIKGHPIASTYSGMAIAYKEMLEDMMYKNVNYFKNLADSEYL